jgi:hypothetical protein
LFGPRTGYLNRHLSTAFKQFECFAFEVFAQELQGSIGVAIHQDAHHLYNILIFKKKIERFFHYGMALLLYPMAGASMMISSSAMRFSVFCASKSGGQSASFFCETESFRAKE